MKYLGNIAITSIKEKDNYKTLFDPLTEAELDDLRSSIRNSGILNSLILEKDDGEYVLLSGHHRKRIAEELKIETVPCVLAESLTERLDALFDNAIRRQVSEEKRKQLLDQKEDMRESMRLNQLAPDIRNLVSTRSLPNNIVERLSFITHAEQRQMLAAFTTQVEIVPEEILQKHEEELNELTAKYEMKFSALKTEIEASRNELKKLAENKKKADESLSANRRELETANDRIEELLEKLQTTKETITETVRKEYESRLTMFVKERETREKIVKTKEGEIDTLKDQIKHTATIIKGLEDRSDTFAFEMKRCREQYNNTILQYSDPLYITVQLKMAVAQVESLITHAKNHKWQDTLLTECADYRKKLDNMMGKLINEVSVNLMEPMDVEKKIEDINNTHPKPDITKYLKLVNQC